LQQQQQRRVVIGSVATRGGRRTGQVIRSPTSAETQPQTVIGNYVIQNDALYIHLYSPSKVANKYKKEEKNLTNYSSYSSYIAE